MGCPRDISLSRLLLLVLRLGAGKPVTSEYIRKTFGVSRATAKRDLLLLECALPVEVEEVRAGARLHATKVLRLPRDHEYLRLLPDAAT